MACCLSGSTTMRIFFESEAWWTQRYNVYQFSFSARRLNIHVLTHRSEVADHLTDGDTIQPHPLSPEGKKVRRIHPDPTRPSITPLFVSLEQYPSCLGPPVASSRTTSLAYAIRKDQCDDVFTTKFFEPPRARLQRLARCLPSKMGS